MTDIVEVEQQVEQLFLEKKKKKSKKDTTATIDVEESGPVLDGTGCPWAPGTKYSYEDLLNRIQVMLQAANPDLGSRKVVTVKPPTVLRISTKKCSWTNFMEVCKSLDRHHDHVLQFVFSELGTEGSISGEDHLILKGKYEAKHFESLLRKYIKEYVTCSMCRSPKTSIERDNATRLSFIKCSACGAHRSVAPINSGFHASTRADRKRAKAAA